jgi:hypothetical protein
MQPIGCQTPREAEIEFYQQRRWTAELAGLRQKTLRKTWVDSLLVESKAVDLPVDITAYKRFIGLQEIPRICTIGRIHAYHSAAVN